ncbi:MAG: ABC transporter substrate-binding protein [Ktedonobacteraceae bacterium]
MRYTKYLLLALLVVLLVGCGGASTTTTASKPTVAAVPTSSVKPVPQKPGSTKIAFWYGLGGPNGDVVRTVINNYNLSQDKYYVEGVFQSSYDDTLSKFNASLSGNALPNVVQIYDIGTQRMIDTKQIIPVQDLVARDNLQSVVEDLEPAIRSYYTLNGKLYSMPFNSSTAVMYYDKNAFRDAGLDVNKKIWTYTELLDAAKKLTKKDANGKIARAGVGFYDYSWFFEQEMAAHNALTSSPNNGRTGRATKFVFNNDIGSKWLDFQKQLLTDGSGVYYGANGSTASTSAFLNGQSAITFESIAALRNFVKTATKNGSKVDVGVAYVPRRADLPQGRTIIGGASLWVTNKGSKVQQDGAWDFVKYTVQPEVQAFWSSNTGYVPVRLATYKLQSMQDTLTKYPQFQVAVDQIRSAPSNYYNAGSVAGNMLTVRNFVQQAIDDYLTGRVSTSRAALDSAAQKSNSSLDEYNASNQ